MKYAIYDVLTPTTPINVWDVGKGRYVKGIYDTEGEAKEKADGLNAYLSEKAYVVKPYDEEVNITLSKSEAKVVSDLLSIAISQTRTPERLQFLQEITNKIKTVRN